MATPNYPTRCFTCWDLPPCKHTKPAAPVRPPCEKDEDCEIGEDLTCIHCGVGAGDPCAECGGRMYHRDGCEAE